MEVCTPPNDVCNNIKMFVHGVKNKKVHHVKKTVYHIMVFKNEVCKEGITLHNKKSTCHNDEAHVIIITVHHIMANAHAMIINEHHVLVNAHHIL